MSFNELYNECKYNIFAKIDKMLNFIKTNKNYIIIIVKILFAIVSFCANTATILQLLNEINN